MGGGVSLEILGDTSLQSMVTLGEIPSTASSRETERSVQLIDDGEALKAGLMERNPRVTADRKSDVGLQPSTMLLFRCRGDGDAVSIGKVYGQHGWKTALLLTASLPWIYAGREKVKGVPRGARRLWKGVQRR